MADGLRLGWPQLRKMPCGNVLYGDYSGVNQACVGYVLKKL